MREPPSDGPSQDALHRIMQAAATYPNRPALSGQRGRVLRYRDLAVAVLATAKGLRRQGFLPGQRLLFALRPDPTAIVLALGTVAAGGTVVFLDPNIEPELCRSRAVVAEAGWVAADSIRYATGWLGAIRSSLPRAGTLATDYRTLAARTLRAGPWLPGVPSGTLSLPALSTKGHSPIDDEPLPGLLENLAAEAVVVFLQRDQPKGVVHTRGSLGAAFSVLAGQYDIGSRSRVYTDQLMIGLPALAAGAHWRLPPFGVLPRVDPARFAKGIGRATHAFLRPADLAAVLTAISEWLAPRPPALRQILLGGSPVSPALLARAALVLPNVRVLTLYGRPEMMPIAIAGDPVAPAGRERDPDGDPVGDVLPDVRARITDDGELMVSGPRMALGYLGEPPLTEFATGDQAILRGGSLVLRYRETDPIVSGGSAVDPAHYAAVVESLPAVGHAALLGISDDSGTQRLVLAVQPAGQPINDSPLASEPKQSNSRDAEDPAGAQVTLLMHHPLAAAVAATLPRVLADGPAPDQIVVLSSLPTTGDGSAVDRGALRRLLTDLGPEDAEQSADPDRSPGGGGRSIRHILGRRTAIGPPDAERLRGPR